MRLRVGLYSIAAAACVLLAELGAHFFANQSLPLAIVLAIAPVLLAGLLAGLFAAGRRHVRPPTPVAEEPAPVPLNFTALPPGGVLDPALGRARVEEELAVAEEYGRPLALLLVGLDVPLGILSADLEDLMAGLEEIVLGAVRAQDVVFQQGRSELLLMLPETRPDLARVVVARIDERARAEVGTARGALAAPMPGQRLADIVEELEEALDYCRSTGISFADPARLLQQA
jgi:hypothetical protein